MAEHRREILRLILPLGSWRRFSGARMTLETK
jgi:hypothetical protein